MDGQPQEFLLEKCSINVKFLENKTEYSVLDIYFRNCKWCSANWDRCSLGLIWRNDSIYLLDSHSKDKNENLWRAGTVFLLKYDTLYYSLENCLDKFIFLEYFRSDFAFSSAVYKS